MPMPTVVDQVVDAVVDDIFQGKIQGGQRLTESSIAQDLKVSRNTVREALGQLVGGGLVDRIPNRGFRLKDFGLRELLELYDLREAIEPIAARLAAELQHVDAIEKMGAAVAKFEAAINTKDPQERWHADYAFHLALVASSGNQRFIQIYESFQTKLAISKWSVASGSMDHLESDKQNDDLTIEAHQAIYQAICDGRAFEARDLAAEHVFYARDGFLRKTWPQITRSGRQRLSPYDDSRTR